MQENIGKKEIAGIIKAIREAKGLRKSEIARQVGVTRQHWEQWENGSTEPKAGYFIKILQAQVLTEDEKKNQEKNKKSLDFVTKLCYTITSEIKSPALLAGTNN